MTTLRRRADDAIDACFAGTGPIHGDALREVVKLLRLCDQQRNRLRLYRPRPRRFNGRLRKMRKNR